MKPPAQSWQSVPVHPDLNARWYVREYGEADEASLLLLYRAVFGRERSVEHLRWKLFSRGNWPGKMVWVAVETGSERVVGHYAGIPLEIMIAGRTCHGVHSVEAMAHPDFRRQGILTALGTLAHEAWAAAGYELVIGLPNDKWGTRNVALGYVPLFPLAWLKFPLRLDRLVKRQLNKRFLSKLAALPAWAASQVWRALHTAGGQNVKVQVSPVDTESQLTGAAIAWSMIAKQSPNAIVRSPEWLRWRYAQEPSGKFRVLGGCTGAHPAGFVAYRLIDDGERVTGYLADLLVAPGDRVAARALLAATLLELDRAGAGSVMAAAPPGSALYAHLTACGFRPIRAGFTFEIVPLNSHIDPDHLNDPAKWHLSAGDFDIV